MMPKKCFAFLLAAGALFAQLPLRNDPNAVVAVVDGKDVTMQEYQNILANAPANIAQMIRTDPQTGLLAWFTSQHLAKEAEEMKLGDKSPWKEQIAAMRAQYLADARVNEEVNGWQPPQAELEKYYNAHLNNYQQVRAVGIMIRFKPEMKVGATSQAEMERLLKGQVNNPSTRKESDAQTLAMTIANRLRAGADMKALVDEFSEDGTSRAAGGDVGWVSALSPHDEEFRAGVLPLAKGQVSDPIAMPGAFWVIRAEDRNALPLNAVKAEVNQEVRKIHMNDYISGIRNRFEPKIVNPMLLQQGAQNPNR